MISTAAKIIGTEILKTITSATVKKIKPEFFQIKKSQLEKIKSKFPELYEIHFNEICQWASSIPFINLAQPKNTKDSTVELLIASDIIQYNDGREKKVDETEILNSSKNILLVGAPGAGKTTTLKRLILRYLSEFPKFGNTGFPILIRLRYIPHNKTLLKHLLDIFSIKYEDRLVPYEKKVKHLNKETGEYFYTDKVEHKLETFVGDSTLSSFVVQFLNQTECLLMLDGLDEVDRSIQLELLREIEEIGLKLTTSKILVTVRKSELRKVINNFTSYEIGELSNEQIIEISNKWLGQNNNFLKELAKKPYKDLANRPIFLTLLLILFGKYSYLPQQPSEVYEDATYLIIKDWDDNRDIIRHSNYTDFNTRKKVRFISEVSYLMTYKIKSKKFTSKDLENIYYEINEKYGLPENEMNKVVSEIESHTGIIVEAGHKNFEFSHLSIQEFLCAKHLVNLPYSKETITYFLEYPEPLAIAICISGEPSLWFANLILNKSLNIINFDRRDPLTSYTSSIYTLLSRLLLESPSFKISKELGFTFFYLFTHLYKNRDFTHLLDQWFQYPNVKESLAEAIKGANYKDTLKNSYIITKKEASPTNFFITIPYTGELPTHYVIELKNSGYIKLIKELIS